LIVLQVIFVEIGSTAEALGWLKQITLYGRFKLAGLRRFKPLLKGWAVVLAGITYKSLCRQNGGDGGSATG
jgi:hypothetical protein